MSQQPQHMQKVPADKLAPFRQALAAAESSFKSALPSTVAKYLTPERITKVTLSALSRSPVLLQCTPQSILRSVMDAVSLGLEPAGPLGHAYLVPFKNNKTGTWEAQLIIGYRGFIALARRSGEIQSVTANVIYSRDRYRVNLAEGRIEHEPYIPVMPDPDDEDAPDPMDLMYRGTPIAVYSVAHFVGGGQHTDFMTVGDVERIRTRSRAGDSGPWKTDWEEMARKTVVRRAAKYWPLSTEMAQAFEVDDADDIVVSPRPSVRELPAPTVVDAAPEETQEAAPAEEHAQAEDYSQVGPPPMAEEEGGLPAEPAKKTSQIANRLRTQQAPAYRARR
jgi:recombination protein RecT